MLKPAERNFKVEVENVGTFVFRFPSLKDEVQIENLTAKLLDYNPSPHPGAYALSNAMATIQNQTVTSPSGWDIDEMYSYDELEAIYKAYNEQVSLFRGSTRREDKKSSIKPNPKS